MEPTHIVVDTRDGYLYRAPSDGVLFTAATARAFAESRNAEMKPEHRTYAVRRLVPDETAREQFARAYVERRDEVLAADLTARTGITPLAHVCQDPAYGPCPRPECGR